MTCATAVSGWLGSAALHCKPIQTSNVLVVLGQRITGDLSRQAKVTSDTAANGWLAWHTAVLHPKPVQTFTCTGRR